MSTPGERLRQARIARGYETTVAAAEALGMPQPTYAQHENGLRGFPARQAPKYARAFGVSEEWLLYGRERPPTAPAIRQASKGHVPLVGYVGAGAAAHFYGSADEGLGEVEAPPDATPLTRAAEIRGESLGPLFEHWLVYYDDVRTPVTPDLIGKLCIVGLPDDRVLVKLLQRSRTEGLYHLLSNSEAPMLDQEVLWAAKVKLMRPR